ncbi:MAG TPA: sulfite reductase, partial [Allosphingosinicella sp.]|nr:sulfite reductase [Allosphingosinicella sp.]
EVERRAGIALAAPHAIAFDEADDHLGWSPQPDGRWTLGVHILSGRVADTEGRALRSALRGVISAYGPAIRLTAQQNLLLQDVDSADRAGIDALLRAQGVETDPGALGVRRDALACPAMPTCGLALAESERALPALLEEISALIDELGLRGERISVRMTGCPNGCARPYMGDIGIVGRSKDLYDVYAGGDWANTTLNRLYRSSVPRAQIIDVLRPALLALKQARHQPIPV